METLKIETSIFELKETNIQKCGGKMKNFQKKHRTFCINENRRKTG